MPLPIFLSREMKLPEEGMLKWMHGEASLSIPRAQLPLSRDAQVDFHCKLSQIKGD